MDKKADFVISMKASGLEEKVINNIFAKFAKTIQLSLSENFHYTSNLFKKNMMHL